MTAEQKDESDQIVSVGQVLASRSFREKAMLLLLSGLVVPLVMFFLNREFEAREKNVERAKAEFVDALAAKRAFWEDTSRTILTLQTLVLDVSWYKTSYAPNVILHEKALDRYSREVVDLTANWRVLISRAEVIASPEVAEKLHALLGEFFNNQDTPVIQLVARNASTEEWDAQHDASIVVLGKANKLVAKIADDLGLRSAN